MWNRAEDAHMRLAGTIVLFNGEPVYVTRVNPDHKVLFCFLSTGKKGEAAWEADAWDYRPVKTGFVNLGREMFFVERVPVRKWKQGLHRENTAVYPERPGIFDIIRTKEFAACIKRDYPSFKDVMRALRNGSADSRAFHPLWGLQKTPLGLVWVCYKKETVGWFEGGKLKLGDGFQFLKESAEEAFA